MIRALYTAASGLLVGLRQQEVVANNLANAETAGYKGETSSITAFGGVLARRVGNAPGPLPLAMNQVLGAVGTGAYQSERKPDFSTGNLKATGRDLDLAISGAGFFAIRAEDGAVQYTRDGHFGRDAADQLVTSEGLPVLDVNGDPILFTGGRIELRPNGEVLVNDEAVATLMLVDFTSEQAVRAGGSRYALAGDPDPFDPASSVLQGVLEEANVDMTRTSSQLMSIQRQFEASQHVFTTVNQTLDDAVRDIGRVG